jgi:hypothetical protein
MSYDFFNLHNSLSIKDLRAGGGCSAVTRSVSMSYRGFSVRWQNPAPHTTRGRGTITTIKKLLDVR